MPPIMVAMSYYSQIPDISRDQERTEKALVALQEVVTRWPKSEYARTPSSRCTWCATSLPAAR